LSIEKLITNSFNNNKSSSFKNASGLFPRDGGGDGEGYSNPNSARGRKRAKRSQKFPVNTNLQLQQKNYIRNIEPFYASSIPSLLHFIATVSVS